MRYKISFRAEKNSKFISRLSGSPKRPICYQNVLDDVVTFSLEKNKGYLTMLKFVYHSFGIHLDIL